MEVSIMLNSNDINRKTLPIVECPGQVQVPTPKELASLDAMRDIKERVRRLKNERRNVVAKRSAESADYISALDYEMDRLKKKWKTVEGKWKADVQERMIYLGHEEM